MWQRKVERKTYSLMMSGEVMTSFRPYQQVDKTMSVFVLSFPFMMTIICICDFIFHLTGILNIFIIVFWFLRC